MCELLAVRSEKPLDVTALLPWARLMEQRGVAGFGWGVAWYAGGRVQRYRSELALCQDDVADIALFGVRSTSIVVHLRRPSLLMGVRIENSQPYLDPERDIAFCHNGYFRRHRELRPEYEGEFEGTSDSEVGFRRYLSLARTVPAEEALKDVAQTLEGNANIVVLLGGGGRLFGHAAHEENPMYRFGMDGMRWLATGLHSPDGYVYKRLFTRAEDVRHIEHGEVVEI